MMKKIIWAALLLSLPALAKKHVYYVENHTNDPVLVEITYHDGTVDGFTLIAKKKIGKEAIFPHATSISAQVEENGTYSETKIASRSNPKAGKDYHIIYALPRGEKLEIREQ
jgi:hypothetical protein